MSSPSGGPRRALRLVIRIAIGLAVSVAFVALAVQSLSNQDVTLGEIGDELKGARYLGVLGYFAILAVLHTLRVWRWGVMLRGMGAVPWRKVAGVCLISNGAIGLLPVRLGEAVRPLLAVESGHVNLSQALATVVVERVLDGILLGLFFLGTLYFLGDYPLPPEFRLGAILTTVVFGGLAASIVVAALFHRQAVAVVRALVGSWAPRLANRLVGMIDEFFNALRTIAKQRGRGLTYFVLTVLMWAVTGFSLLPLFWAFDVSLPLVASFAVICCLVVGYLIPAGPGATGTLNYAIILALTAFGVDEVVTGTLSILIYFLLLLGNLVAGLFGLYLANVSLKSVWQQLKRPIAESEPQNAGAES